ncbi:S8 family serine peptidase [Roseateles sp. BYS78W]|uniref:S8 family serine peptidase n=1 Tax=Pelomonas candidula TaxID=3299025 RepID=A0ABW7HDT2_9BURK
MRPLVFSLSHKVGAKRAAEVADSADARLASLLPRLINPLKVLDDQHVEMSAALFGALRLTLGADGTARELKKLGLVDARPLAWSLLLRRDRHIERDEAASARTDNATDVMDDNNWHLKLCRVPELEPKDDPRKHDWGTVRVGQIDTGITSHPALGYPAHSWVDERAARSFDGYDGLPGRDGMRGLNAGHGTASASLCAGYDPSAKPPYNGVAPCVPLVPVRLGHSVVLDHHTHNFEAAVHYLVDEAKVPLITVSMGTFLVNTAPEPMWRALNHCYERGVILVAAAGNLPVPGWPAYPAALPRAIAVAGVNRRGRAWVLSSSGAYVDISAPAASVRRAVAINESQFIYSLHAGGTSCATAMVAGAAACWLRHHDGALAPYVGHWRIVEAFRLALTKSATRDARPPTAIGAPEAGWVPESGYGAGILNVEALLAYPLPPPTALTRR